MNARTRIVNFDQVEKICGRPDCDRKHYAKGLCRHHYAKTQYHYIPKEVKKRDDLGNSRIILDETDTINDIPMTVLMKQHKHLPNLLTV